MPTIADTKYAALQALTGASVGTINDLENLWLAGLTSTTGTTLDLYLVWLTAEGYTSGTVNDRLYALMGDEGYTGTLNDRLLQFWVAGGALTAPDVPSGLTATTFDDTTIDLAWVDESDDETGFIIERSLDGLSWVEHDTAVADATTYQDTGLTAATTYYYRVRAQGATAVSAPSVADSATTDPA